MHAEAVDACTYTSASNWNSYYAAQPNVYGLGFYLGGTNASAHGCTTPSSSWLSGLNTNWNLIPIYDSLQSSCEGGDSAFSDTASTAKSQGVTIADHAVNALVNIGLNGVEAVYLDLEHFDDSGSTCYSAARSFVQGWDQELHSAGYEAGLYTSASNTDDFWTISTPPDDAWYADYTARNGYSNADTVSTDEESTYISTSHWSNHTRIHQWKGSTTSNVGSATFSLDFDCADGDLDGGVGVNTACHAPSY